MSWSEEDRPGGKGGGMGGEASVWYHWERIVSIIPAFSVTSDKSYVRQKKRLGRDISKEKIDFSLFLLHTLCCLLSINSEL